MDAKSYLSQARHLDMRIRSKFQQIDSLNDLARSCAVIYSDMPRATNHGHSRQEECVIKIVALQEQLQDDAERMIALKKEITDVIRKVNDPDQATLLEERYLCFLSWEKIAVDMHYSIQHIYRIHDAALQAVEEFLPESVA